MLKMVLLATVVILLVTPLGTTAGTRGRALDAVVQIRARSQPYDLARPWMRGEVETSGGSGVVIAGRRILTAAHVVDGAVGIEVKRHDSSRWVSARTRHISHQADLASLVVEGDEFFEGVKPIGFGKKIALEDHVTVLGFPVGGSEVSITRGIVSRIEVGTYVQSGEELLLVQTDAAVNPGNSGGPVLADGKIVGIAIQGLDDADNVGYMVPPAVLDHFLRDTKDGQVDGVPRSGIWWQTLDADQQRESLGLSGDHNGLLVVHVDPASTAAGTIEAGDVLVGVDGHPVEQDGSIELPGVGRVNFEYAFQRKQTGEDVELSFRRDGSSQKAKMPLRRHHPLIEASDYGSSSQHFVFGGAVFRPLTVKYLSLYRRVDRPAELEAAVLLGHRTDERRQIVLISSFLESASNTAYRWAEDEIVEAVNGVRIRDLRHLAELIDTASGQWVEIRMQDERRLVFNREAELAERGEIVADNGLPADRSPDLLPIPASAP